MFQGWSRMNNPQAKVLTTVPRAAWHQGVLFYMVFLGTQATSESIEALPLHAGLCRGGPNSSLANCGRKMEYNKLNKNMCEEIFGGEMDVVEVPDELDNKKSQARQHCDWLHNLHNRDVETYV